MAHLGNGIEYGLHCLLWLVGTGMEAASSRDLAELQGVSPSFLAKIFPKLEKAGIVRASEGIRGGYLLARRADHITVLDVVDAIEGKKPLFECQEIRSKCAVFGRKAPRWSTEGVCAIHALMLRAEQSMRSELASTTIADLAGTVGRKAPSDFAGEVRDWLASRVNLRGRARGTGVREAKAARNRAS
ncbi:RrF2 family transcriptional regulator [Bradyrhizobium tropiciagri]|uniref:RrF2 family transcriptional regulator n=1 Tax=Bradyrhizobium tropiciagri TaxID=312253 RepID=UPI00067B4C33|nr:Rrf2 family transcriptional regulator [Bradyrhizobium tropiciagri]